MATDTKSTIIELYKKLFEAFDAGKLDEFTAHYTTDCKSVAQGSARCGREGLKETCKTLLANGERYKFKSDFDVIISDDESMAYLTVLLEVMKSDGTTSSGTNLCIFKKVDGAYLVSLDMYC